MIAPDIADINSIGNPSNFDNTWSSGWCDL